MIPLLNTYLIFFSYSDSGLRWISMEPHFEMPSDEPSSTSQPFLGLDLALSSSELAENPESDDKLGHSNDAMDVDLPSLASLFEMSSSPAFVLPVDVKCPKLCLIKSTPVITRRARDLLNLKNVRQNSDRYQIVRISLSLSYLQSSQPHFQISGPTKLQPDLIRFLEQPLSVDAGIVRQLEVRVLQVAGPSIPFSPIENDPS